MASRIYTPEEIAQRGEELYQREIRGTVEQTPANRCRLLALDIESGDYALAEDSLHALEQLEARRPNAPIYIVRVGYPTAVKIGAGRRLTTGAATA